MKWTQKSGNQLVITPWSVKLYKVLWLAAILMITFSIIGIIFLSYEFVRFDSMDVLNKIGEIPMQLEHMNEALARIEVKI